MLLIFTLHNFFVYVSQAGACDGNSYTISIKEEQHVALAASQLGTNPDIKMHSRLRAIKIPKKTAMNPEVQLFWTVFYWSNIYILAFQDFHLTQ